VGRNAQAIGSAIEEWAEISFRRYEAKGRLTWFKCYPATKTIFDGQRKRTILLPEEGPPDYCLCLALRPFDPSTTLRGAFAQENQGSGQAPAGRLLWLEIKTWEGAETHTERKRLHQYRQMVEAGTVGGLGAYLVAWRKGNLIDWRLHPVGEIEAFDNANALVFRRSQGRPVAAAVEGWPEWWAALQVMEMQAE